MVTKLAAAILARSSWRFSMREMLLAMTALAAILALAIQSRSWFGPTPFFDRFSPFQVARLALADEGVKVDTISGDRGTETVGRVSRLIFAFTIDAGEVSPERAMNAFRARVEQEIQDSGGSITGQRYIGPSADDGLQRFCFLYEDHWREGEIIAYLVPGKPGEFKVTGMIHEF
jgi:hypothetical protein